MNTQKSLYSLLFLSLMVAGTTACGGGDGGGLPSNNNNETNNSTNNNGTANNTNTNPNNTNNTNNSNNTNNTNNSNNTNNIDPTGTALFAQPTDATVYANGDLLIEAVADDAVEDLELVLDDDTALTTLDGSLEYTWDTTGTEEGTHSLMLRYTLGGEASWSADERQVIVDRTAPTLTSWLPGLTRATIPSDTQIMLEFDEALDPATVNPTSVSFAVEDGDPVTYTVELLEDGKTIEIDFDRTTVPTPYSATVEFTTVADLAGNTVADSVGWRVDAWRSEDFQASLDKPAYAEIGGEEFIVGYVNGSPTDYVRVYGNDGAGNWTLVDEMGASQIYDVDIDVYDGVIYIAALHRDNVSGTTVKGAELMKFDPATATITSEGLGVVGMDSNNGAISVAVATIRAGASPTFVIGAVSNGRVVAFRFSEGNLNPSLNSTFPSVDYDYVRDESLSVGHTGGSRAQVIFARCTSAATPCYQTIIERVSETSTGWAENPAVLGTPRSIAYSSQCDEFNNFDVTFDLVTPTLLLSYNSSCNNLLSGLKSVEGDNSDWLDISPIDGVMGTMPDADNDRYKVSVEDDTQDRLHALMYSPQRMMLARYGASDVTWLSELAESLSPTGANTSSFLDATLSMDANDKPLVVFRFSNKIYVWRTN